MDSWPGSVVQGGGEEAPDKVVVGGPDGVGVQGAGEGGAPVAAVGGAVPEAGDYFPAALLPLHHQLPDGCESPLCRLHDEFGTLKVAAALDEGPVLQEAAPVVREHGVHPDALLDPHLRATMHAVVLHLVTDLAVVVYRGPEYSA